MFLRHLLLAELVLFAMTWRGGSVIATSSPEDLSLVEDLAYILTSCNDGRLRGAGLAGNLPEDLQRILTTQHLIPVALIDDTLGYSNSTIFQPLKFRQQLPVFIVEASSTEELSYTIQRNIRGTIWWNHMASFFILDRSSKCINVANFLFVAYSLDILNAKVICNQSSMKRFIYNSNPYTIKAPAPWKRLNVFRTMDNHSFTVFIQIYTKNQAICLNLDFDKTINLAGYEISVEALRPHLTQFNNWDKTLNEYHYWSTRERVFQNIFHSLNATPKFRSVARIEDPVFADIRKVGRLMLYVWIANKITYPHAHTGFILISKFRGHKTQLEKILNVIDCNSRFGMVVVYFVTLIFLKFFFGQTPMQSLLNLVRITCNTGFTNLPRENPSRIFIGCLLFFVVTMQGIYQGNLATLLTTNIPLRDVNVLKDVVDFKYKLYGNDYMANIVEQYPELKGRFVRTDVESNECLEHVLNDSSAACLWIAQGWILDRIRQHELHTSSEFVATFYSGFEIRWDWPLEQRVNVILSRMVEADVIPPWDVRCQPLRLTDFKYDKEVLNNKTFKNIELGELTFAFVILGIGMACASTVFVVELANSRYNII